MICILIGISTFIILGVLLSKEQHKNAVVCKKCGKDKYIYDVDSTGWPLSRCVKCEEDGE